MCSTLCWAFPCGSLTHSVFPMTHVLWAPESQRDFLKARWAIKDSSQSCNLLVMRSVCSVPGMDLKRSRYLEDGKRERFPLEGTAGRACCCLSLQQKGEGFSPQTVLGISFPCFVLSPSPWQALVCQFVGDMPASNLELCSQTREN